MKHIGIVTFGAGLAAAALTFALYSPDSAEANNDVEGVCSGGSGYEMKRLGGDEVDDLCRTYGGKVWLVVNTASRCGYTGQYEGLERLYDEYKDEGLVVIGFPSNDFRQEPGTDKAIQDFCRLTYGVQFPMYAKTSVRGADAAPLYKALAKASGESPRWNFHKYVVDREGRVVGSFRSAVDPWSTELVGVIEKAL